LKNGALHENYEGFVHKDEAVLQSLSSKRGHM